MRADYRDESTQFQHERNRMWRRILERAERKIYREHYEDIREALRSKSATEYLGESK